MISTAEGKSKYNSMGRKQTMNKHMTGSRTKVYTVIAILIILTGASVWGMITVHDITSRLDALDTATSRLTISTELQAPIGHQWEERERWVVDSGYYTKIISPTQAITLEKKEFVFDTYEEALKKLNECEISGCGLDRNLQKFSLTQRDERVLVHVPLTNTRS